MSAPVRRGAARRLGLRHITSREAVEAEMVRCIQSGREPGPVIPAVRGGLSGKVWTRESQHFGGAWWASGEWKTWHRLVEDERWLTVDLPSRHDTP